MLFIIVFSLWNSKVIISYWPLVFYQSKRTETEIEKVQLSTLCNFLKIQEEEKEGRKEGRKS